MKHLSVALGLSAMAFLFSCTKNADALPEDQSALMAKPNDNNQKDIAVSFYALATGNRLDFFNLQQSEQPLRSVAITGIQGGERILAIDFRPATGQLYGLGSTSRLYIINVTTGAARPVGATAFTPVLTGELVGFDFNPTVDRIRVVTSAGQNLRLNPETGTVAAVDKMINGAPGAMLSGAAYTNNEAGATTTTLYDIDGVTGKLYKQLPPNDGTLVEVGSLEAELKGEGGFDIAPTTDGGMNGYTALALYNHNKKSSLYSIDLNTGRARKITKFEKDDIYYGIAIPTNPVAYAVSMDKLLIFNPTNPSVTVSKTITGLQMGETIVGIDFRPANSALYAIGSNSRIYQLNTSNGMATFIAALSTPLSGTSFGVDFNPVPDRIRIVSNTGQNLRVNPMDGVTNVDAPINPMPASITAAGYTNSFAGATATMLFVIDSDNDMLYIQTPPNNGTLTNGKSLGINIEASNGFDIGGTTNMAYGLFSTGGTTKLYSVDLTSGMAMATGNFTSTVTGFSLGLGF